MPLAAPESIGVNLFPRRQVTLRVIRYERRKGVRPHPGGAPRMPVSRSGETTRLSARRRDEMVVDDVALLTDYPPFVLAPHLVGDRLALCGKNRLRAGTQTDDAGEPENGRSVNHGGLAGSSFRAA